MPWSTQNGGCSEHLQQNDARMSSKVIRKELWLHVSLHFSKPASNYSITGLIPDLNQSPERPTIHCLLSKLKRASFQSMNEDGRNKEIKRTNIESSLNAQSAHVYWPLSSGAVECQKTLDKVYFCDNFLLIMWNTCTSTPTHSQRQPLGSSCGRC